jgi:ketosteroid isomerase-like protein
MEDATEGLAREVNAAGEMPPMQRETERTTMRIALAIATGMALGMLVPGTPTFAAALPAATAEQDQEARNAAIIRQAYARWAAGGTQFFDEVLSPDVRWTIRGSGPAARTYVGREAFLRDAVTPFGSRLKRPLKPTVRHLFTREDLVIAVWDGVGTALDDKPYTNSYVWVFRMRDGRATEVEAFLDLVPYYDVLNRIPDPQRMR